MIYPSTEDPVVIDTESKYTVAFICEKDFMHYKNNMLEYTE